MRGHAHIFAYLLDSARKRSPAASVGGSGARGRAPPGAGTRGSHELLACAAVAVSTAAVGKTYAVGREKIREYAFAVGETNPLHLEVGAARAAGYRDVVAPPMFAAVYSSP